MKRFIYLLATALVTVLTVQPLKAETPLAPDSITMSAGYANEVYYSMSGGTVLASPRTSWDIAFRTRKMSSSILTNDGAGVILYTYPKSDTSGWATVDTNGLAAWKPMYNDPNDWENGAFSRNALSFPDYGWAVYNEVTHDLVGDSIFIIVLRDQSIRKLWIERKKSVQDIYIFKFADINGSNEHQVSLDLNAYTGKDFYGYSLEDNAGVDYQPERGSWDLVFTKYMSVQPNGSPYIVTGVLSNDSVRTKGFHHTPVTYGDWWVGTWDSTRSSIGYNWKTFDMNNFVYVVEDSLVYFVRNLAGDVYKLVFTRFDGSSTGVTVFETAKISSLGIDPAVPEAYGVIVYPNPATGHFTVQLPVGTAADATVTVSDITGRTLFRTPVPAGTESLRVSTAGFSPGTYLISVSSSSVHSVSKVLVAR
jgi:hypothetical protein